MLADYDPLFANVSVGDPFSLTFRTEATPSITTPDQWIFNAISSTLRIDDGTPSGLTLDFTYFPSYAFTLTDANDLYLEASQHENNATGRSWQVGMLFGFASPPSLALPTSPLTLVGSQNRFGFFSFGGYDAAFGNIDTYAAYVVPAPGAPALLGLTCLAVVRRRR